MLLTATASVGTFTACSNEDPKVNERPDVKTSTTMSIQFAFQKPVRGAADDQNTTNPGYNYVGKWVGNDYIESVDVYIFQASTSATGATGFALESKQTLNNTQLTFEQPKNGNQEVSFIRPTKGFKVQPGQKKVFVVVNPNAETQALLDSKTDFDDFKAAYDGVMRPQLNNSDAPTTYTEATAANAAASTDPFTVADHLAKVKDQNSANAKDITVMTGDFGEQNVQDNVTETQTLDTYAPVNRVNISVQRAVARVLVTSDKASYEIKGDNPTTEQVESEATGDAVKIATITNLTYVVAQGESSLYFNQQNSDDAANHQFKTPNTGYVPAGTADDPASDYDATTVYKKYDYTGLWRKHDNKQGGYDVPTNDAYKQAIDHVTGLVQNGDGLHGEFILANTHKYDADRAGSGYRKGNTPYILIRGTIEPEYVWTAKDQYVNDWKTTHANEDLFLGDDGKFYASAELAQDPNTNGNATAKSMKVKRFVKGKVLYFIWVNPDKTDATQWVNSPAIRNNIYHVQIAGIINFKYNWNPLIPNPNDPVDPNNPVSPTNPRDPNNPNNPDPQPSVPDPEHPGKNIPDPKEPPVDIKPNDPLSLKEAWMSVDVTILPWQVHSAKFILQ